MVYVGGMLLIVGLVGGVVLAVGFVATIVLMTWDLLTDRDAVVTTETAEVRELHAA